ncbi:MAG TPA: hypothetical protein VFE65_12705 [Pseudonocardia sp.]|jgi:hypothetical protein|nr:hypothetical protein [Pseudonocardia sp.]
MTQHERCRDCSQARHRSEPGALAWMHDRNPDGSVTWLCATCARVNLRSIESRLPDEYW